MSRRLHRPLLRRWRILGGAMYGVGLYVVMTYLVVPISRATPHYPASPWSALPDLLAMILFGLVVALIPRRVDRVLGGVGGFR